MKIKKIRKYHEKRKYYTITHHYFSPPYFTLNLADAYDYKVSRNSKKMIMKKCFLFKGQYELTTFEVCFIIFHHTTGMEKVSIRKKFKNKKGFF